MTHVKHQSVAGSIKDTVDGHRQLNNAQIGRKMTAGPGYPGQQEFAQLTAKKARFFVIEILEILRIVDTVKNQKIISHQRKRWSVFIKRATR